MAEVHHHHYSAGTEINHLYEAATAAQSDLQAAGFASLQQSQAVLSQQIDGTPDADTKVSDIVGAASTIAAAFVARNYEKHGDRGQYSLDTIARMSVSLAEKIHADVHATVHGTD